MELIGGTKLMKFFNIYFKSKNLPKLLIKN